MRAFKGILLTGTAILALVACSSDKGPGEIGSLDDIVVRNAGEKSAMPPPGADPVKQVKIDDAATAGDTSAPTAAEVIAAEDTGTKKTVEETAAAAQEAQEKAIAQQQEQIADAAPAPVVEQADAAPAEQQVASAESAGSMNWNQPRRITNQDEADALVKEQMATSAPPTADAAPTPSAPPAEDVATATQTQAPAAAPAQPKIPVTAPENYTQDPNAPYSPAAARAAAAAQTGTPSDAPAPLAAADAPAQATATASADTAPTQPMALAAVDGPMPLDAAVLQSKDPASIKSLQKTLADAGFYKGALNGEMNSDTLNAYVKYQTAAQVNAAPAAPAEAAPAPVPQEAAPAPAPYEQAPMEATAEPTPVMDQMSPAPMQAMTPATPEMNEAPPPAVRQRPRVSRRTPAVLPPVEPFVEKTPVFPEAAAAAPAPMAQPAPSAPAPAASATFGANASVSDPAVISAAQQALAAKGLYTGAINGVVDANTLNAIIRYQTANNLTAGLLNTETLQSLGVVK